MEIVYLCFFAFLAGFIDSIVGGGGLIQLPALLIFLPGTPIPTLLGTGKVSSLAGTSVAILRYARNVVIPWRAVLPAALSAFAFSFLGARAVSLLDPALLRPLILVLLVVVFAYTLTKKDLGTLHAPRLSGRAETGYALLVGTLIGFYDGFFGPGTGSFLIFAFVGLFGFNFLAASAAAKTVNLATNLSALLYFAATDNIRYRVALPMAACSIIGSFAGTRLAIAKGSGFVRVLFLVVVSGIICKLAYDYFGQ
ncbi:MAG: TSUP family transporter [Cytophagales bacterium]|nr:TSUP family transporter [Cytophagales bacterium]